MNIFNLDRTFKINVETASASFSFTGQFPSRLELRRIGLEWDIRMDGRGNAKADSPLSYLAEHEWSVVTLNHVIREYPDGFLPEGIKPEAFDWINVPDDEFVNRVYAEFEKQYSKWESELKKNLRPPDRGRTGPPPVSGKHSEPVFAKERDRATATSGAGKSYSRTDSGNHAARRGN